VLEHTLFTGTLPAPAGRTLNENRKPAGPIAGPASQIVACRHAIRKCGGLAPAAGAPRCTATCATCACPPQANPDTSATSTASAACAASDAAAAASASSKGCASSSASAATATTTSARSDLNAAGDAFVVEEMEGSEADVGDFFFTERDRLTRRKVRRLWYVGCRYGCQRTPRQRKSQPGGAQRRYRAFGQSLPFFRSLLHPLHGRILRTLQEAPL
jgi:hypothetical protein